MKLILLVGSFFLLDMKKYSSCHLHERTRKRNQKEQSQESEEEKDGYARKRKNDEAGRRNPCEEKDARLSFQLTPFFLTFSLHNFSSNVQKVKSRSFLPPFLFHLLDGE